MEDDCLSSHLKKASAQGDHWTFYCIGLGRTICVCLHQAQILLTSNWPPWRVSVRIQNLIVFHRGEGSEVYLWPPLAFLTFPPLPLHLTIRDFLLFICQRRAPATLDIRPLPAAARTMDSNIYFFIMDLRIHPSVKATMDEHCRPQGMLCFLPRRAGLGGRIHSGATEPMNWDLSPQAQRFG